MNNSLNEIQIRLLEMLGWFHQYCVKNNIKYYLLGGTMLGAARHKGFIPWDDDIDVGIPRKDYEKFLQTTKRLRQSNNKYIVESWKDGKRDYEYPYAKVYDTTTTLIENKRKKIKRGIFIDVFPLDGIGNSEAEVKSNYRTIELKFNLLSARTCAVREGRNKVKNLAVKIMSVIPESVFNARKMIATLNELCQKNDFETSGYVGNLMGAWHSKEIMLKKVYGNPTLYDFEGIQVYGVENYDAYLTHMYGDWRELPPKEKRVTHHDFIELNLNQSYLGGNL